MTQIDSMTAGQDMIGDVPQLGTEERIAHLRLIRTPNIGPMTFSLLMQRYGSAVEALRAVPDLARRGGRSLTPAGREQAEAELAANREAGATLLFKGHPGYPERIARFEDAPPVLSALGDRGLLNRPMVAVTGSRDPSKRGIELAGTLAGGLAAEGYVVVAGLAPGIDVAAHAATIANADTGAGGTVAVLPAGIDNMYPPETAGLRARIAGAGLLLAEAPPGTAPTPRQFPIRNRVIAGLVLGTVIIEAPEDEGAMIIARETMERGGEIMAVPGCPLDPLSAGGNRLICEAGTPVRNVADILACLARAR